MKLSIEKKRVVVVNVASAVAAIVNAASTIIETSTSRTEEEWMLLKQVERESQHIRALLEEEEGQGWGHGNSPWPQLPTIALPKSGAFDLYVQLPETFKQECGFYPSEFDRVLTGVMDVMVLCRDVDDEYGEELNAARRKRRFKYSTRERLFIFFVYARQYQSLRRTANTWMWSTSSVYAEFLWLRKKLVVHPEMRSKVKWGTPEEREEERRALVAAGAPLPRRGKLYKAQRLVSYERLPYVKRRNRQLRCPGSKSAPRPITFAQLTDSWPFACGGAGMERETLQQAVVRVREAGGASSAAEVLAVQGEDAWATARLS